MTLLLAILALNLAFAVYLFVSLRGSPESFWDRSSSKPTVTRMHPFYDAFSSRQGQLVRVRSNSGQY